MMSGLESRLFLVYINNNHAKYEWGFTMGKRKDFGIPFGIIKNPTKKSYQFLRKMISEKIKKSQKYFGVDRKWLCIEERSPLSEEKDVAHFISNINIGKNDFEKIFILHHAPSHEGGGYKTFEIK